MPVLEIRTYRLKPGTRDEFVRVMREDSMPLLAAAGIRVLDSGPSLVDEDGFEEAYLVRVFDSIEHRDAQEEAFYGSAAWREGPREAIVSRIETYHTIVVDVPEAVVTNWTPSSR
ncbi:MAG: NIPSNAP family protein [Hamadaea sp.]|uniref:NIPSNAP family protein n=1 Tax=Hamadaea sp. TaxID=2024425 RepID=UPI0017C74A06|nr:NIPSNAP family protein [Hamadaea sp.]NUT21492.1 NIPSNAP family protein [Hamadaea sp.]